MLKRPLLLLCILAAICPPTLGHSQQGIAVEPTRYSGMSDASAAVVVGDTTFLVADDEQNTLRVYDSDRPGAPVQTIPWDGHLGIDPRQDEHPEVDVEGATVLGGRVYWISSHGRNKDGRWRPNRHRFFAMTIRTTREGVVAEPFGVAYRNLAIDLVDDRRLQDLGLARALGSAFSQSRTLAPKRNGLNIEGLSATADGKSLLIALRNPRGGDDALLVPLENPAAVLTDGAAPRFGEPIQLELQARVDGTAQNSGGRGLGIRSIEYSKRHGACLLVAGPHDQKPGFALYRWSGVARDRPQLLEKATKRVNDLEDFTPEALIVYPGRDKIQLLSDDGTLLVKVRSPAECKRGTFDNGRCEAKYLLDETRRTFRSIWIEVE
ncbi:MAG: hypothetical protein A2V70_08290 [Planctomycetes bacterium RBG_13_63_9]|nr:MAG: hypothetical protein A2V70_08290 [Planctomycetes bacterium RBG_13_63_9]